MPAIQLDSQHTIDALEPCMAAGTCDLGFTLDVGDSPGGEIEVRATAGRGGDPSFCFPDSREFAGDATIEVIFE